MMMIWIRRLFAGASLIVVGLCMFAGLTVLSAIPTSDWLRIITVAICVQMYSIVATLFLLLGVQYIVGDKCWLDSWAERLAGGLVVSALLASVLVTAIVIGLWVWAWL